LEKGLEQLRFIEEEIKTLLRVAKGSELIQVPGNLILVISESVQLLRPYCQHQQIEFQTEIKDIATEITDTEGFRGALLNILINATEAAGPQGKVQLLMSTIDEMLEIVIQDNGHGIKPEIEAQIFEPFFTTKPEGAGLGLALARQAIHDNGGELTYARKDGWTVFKIVLNL
jgi:signal transduction histidine kinase